jgi:GNAT superfamily N-acetyltransferase
MEQDVVIRSARPADLLAVAAVRSDVLIADADGHPVGFCTVYLDILSVRFGQRSWIEDLAVHPDRRSQSIGRRLMTAAQDWDANAALPTWNWTPATTAHERTGSTKAGSRHRVPSASAGPSDHATSHPCPENRVRLRGTPTRRTVTARSEHSSTSADVRSVHIPTTDSPSGTRTPID